MSRKALTPALLATACLIIPLAAGCQSTENGTTKTEKTRIEEGPDGKTKTTTTTERKVEDYPR